MKAACNTRTFPHRSLRGAPRLWDGAAGSRPQGRAAHTAPAHTSAAGAPVSPASRWDFCTLVLPLLVLSPAPFPHRSAQFPHRSAPLSHRSRIAPAQIPLCSAPRAPMFAPLLPRTRSTLSVSPSQPAAKKRSRASRTDGAAGTAPSRACQDPDGVRTSKIKTFKHALGSDTTRHGYEEDGKDWTGAAAIMVLKSHGHRDDTGFISPVLYKHTGQLFAPTLPQLALLVSPLSEMTYPAPTLHRYSWSPTCHQQRWRTPAWSKGCSSAQWPPDTGLLKGTRTHQIGPGHRAARSGLQAVLQDCMGFSCAFCLSSTCQLY